MDERRGGGREMQGVTSKDPLVDRIKCALD